MSNSAPGWYPDAQGVIRWWDGTNWTEQVQGAAAPAPGQPGQPGAYGAPAYGAPSYGSGYGGAYPGPWPPTDYLNGAPSGFGGAISDAVRNAFVYRGRASRSSYWWVALLIFLIDIVALIAGAIRTHTTLVVVNGTLVKSSHLHIAPWYSLIALVFLVVGLPLLVRRLHDSDKSGWLALLAFIPLAGAIAILVLVLLPSTPGPNKHQIPLAA